MQLIYAQEPIPNQITKSIFLAGPSLRPGQAGESWRKRALQILEIMQYDGVVFIPEARVGNFEDFDYDKQVRWETRCLRIADHILFYINRNVEDKLLGLTTNDEWGYWKTSGKCVLVTELNADSVRYQEWWADELGFRRYHDMFNGLNDIISRQENCMRVDGERFIPIEIWKTDEFQKWYTQLKENGNWISDAKILHTYRLPNGKLFAFSIWASVFIKSENRYKNNEFLFARPDISSCLLYFPNENVMDTDIILVSEFRTPVVNSMGKVYELPGGSSVKPGVDPKERIIEELAEETGFEPSIAKLELVAEKQLASTLLTHKSYLYKYKLDQYEFDRIKNNENKVFGNIEDSERTEIHIVKVKDVIAKDYLDWTNVGQILLSLLV